MKINDQQNIRHSTPSTARPQTRQQISQQKSRSHRLQINSSQDDIASFARTIPYSSRDSCFLQSPPGVRIITAPQEDIFSMYLDGKLSAQQLVELKIDKGNIKNDENLNLEFQKRKTLKSQVFDTVFENNLKQFIETSSPIKRKGKARDKTFINLRQNNKNQKIVSSENLNAKQKSRGEYLTIEHKEQKGYTTQQEFNNERKKTKKQRSMKNDILIRYLQKLNKAKFTQEELDLLEKEEKSEQNIWGILRKFQKKKWLFSYMLRDQGDIQEQGSRTSSEFNLFQKLQKVVNTKIQEKQKNQKDQLACQLGNTIEKRTEQLERKIKNKDLIQNKSGKFYQLDNPVNVNLKQVSLKTNKFKFNKNKSAKLIRQEASAQKQNIKYALKTTVDNYLQDQQCKKIQHMEKGFETYRKQHQIKKLSSYDLRLFEYLKDNEKEIEMENKDQRNILDQVYDSEDENQLNQLKRSQKIRGNLTKRNKYAQEEELSYQKSFDSQEQSFVSVTEGQLHNLYKASRESQQKLINEKDEKVEGKQRHVRNMIRIVDYQKEMINAINKKLQQ